jgi:hypothetical protein
MASAATHRRRRRPIWPVVVLGVLLLPVACTAWVLGSRDPSRYVATLDELQVPSGWEVVRTDAQQFLVVRALRSYLVDAEPVDAVSVLKSALLAAGFQIYYPPVPRGGCAMDPQDSDHPTCGNAVTRDCESNGPGGPISCYVEAYRRIDADPEHLEDVLASVAPPGSTVDYGPHTSPRFVKDPNRALVTVTASLTRPRHFWSGPTPSPGSGY